MNINNNILKAYLKNCFFINGTAYAGKSTMCRMLAEKYHLLLCGENYGLDRMLQIITPEEQPNLSYFNTMKDWQEFVNRTPDKYLAWIRGNGYEAADFEIAELIRLSGDRKTIVDTNIPLDILRQIADYHQVAVMLSPQSMSVDRFFDREDEEKQFLLSQIRQSPDPENHGELSGMYSRSEQQKYMMNGLTAAFLQLSERMNGRIPVWKRGSAGKAFRIDT